MTVGEIVEEPFRIHGMEGSVAEALEQVKLAPAEA